MSMPNQKRPIVAVTAGGNSGEYTVSLNSAANIMAHIDTSRFEPLLFVLQGDQWFCDTEGQQIGVDKSDFSFTRNQQRVTVDVVFNMVHGTPGEDGILQGYFDLLGIPCTSSGRLTAALTFNKYFCSRFVAGARCVNLTDSVMIRRGAEYQPEEILAVTGIPCFVKPNQGGSSVGMSKVKTEKELIPAISLAFEQDREVLVEAFIAGTEVTCGVFTQNGQTIVLPLTEIVSKTEFFDYEAKYHGQSDEITPARIGLAEETEVKRVSALLYKYLECKGFVRFDYIISSKGVFFLEVNTVPGMSKESIIPQMLEYHGLPLSDFCTAILEETLPVPYGSSRD
jgi:D-alanine-D-alanine ligase